MSNLERLDYNAIERVNGPSWKHLKNTFLELSEILLDAAPSGVAKLTTSYVKFQLSNSPTSGVYAVVWIKSSKNFVLGLALPESANRQLGPPPAGMSYKGITWYIQFKPGDSLPDSLRRWAAQSVENTSALNTV